MLKNNKTEPVKDQNSKDNTEKTADNEKKADNTADSTKTQSAEKEEDLITEEAKEEKTEKAESDPKDLMIQELNEKNKELNDKYLRLFSEFDNFRKRSIKERLELTKSASAEMIEAVLPVLDDLERALQAEGEKVDQGSAGLNLIVAKLRAILRTKGLEEMNSLGESFNTDFHEAITHIPAPKESDKGKVIDEVQKGYLLNGKVLRFAKVVVAN
jgi:molecular chaperone GrpE